MDGVFNKSSVLTRLDYGFGSQLFLASTSIEMASSTISDLRPFVRRRDLLLGVNGGVVRLQFYRYGISDLTSPSRF
jgi:hypothetical protein